MIPSNKNPANIGRRCVYENLAVHQLYCSNDVNGLPKQISKQMEKKKRIKRKKKEKKIESALAANITFESKENEMDKDLSKESPLKITC